MCPYCGTSSRKNQLTQSERSSVSDRFLPGDGRHCPLRDVSLIGLVHRFVPNKVHTKTMANQRTRARRRARGLPGNTSTRPRHVTWSEHVVEHVKAGSVDKGMADLFSALGSITLARRKNPRDSLHESRGRANQYLLALGDDCDPAIHTMIWSAFERYPGTCNVCIAQRHALLFKCASLVKNGECVCDCQV